MSIQKRLVYMVVGGFLALSLFIGAFAVFAQSGDDGESEDATTTVPEPEAGAAENSAEESSAEAEGSDSILPGRGFGFRGYEGGADVELLAEALGISVDELEAAFATANEAAIQQAVDEGLLTEEQAEQLADSNFGFHKGFGHGLMGGSIDFEALLADALGITVEELQDARQEVHAARLAEMVDAGVISQEQADLMLARMAVQEFVDTEAVSDALQSAYEAAVNDALAAGEITEDQAALMLENMPDFGGFNFGLGGGPGFGGHHGRGFGGHHGGPNGFGMGFGNGSSNSSSSAETAGA